MRESDVASMQYRVKDRRPFHSFSSSLVVVGLKPKPPRCCCSSRAVYDNTALQQKQQKGCLTTDRLAEEEVATAVGESSWSISVWRPSF
jgi:hypothetical protein